MIRYWGGGGGGGGVHTDGSFLRHGACLVLSSPLDMGGFWRSPAPHPRQNLVQYPPRDTETGIYLWIVVHLVGFVRPAWSGTFIDCHTCICTVYFLCIFGKIVWKARRRGCLRNMYLGHVECDLSSLTYGLKLASESLFPRSAGPVILIYVNFDGM